MRKLCAVVAAAVVGAASTGCSNDDSPGADRASTPSFGETVTITGSGYHPSKARVLVGGRVTWINRDPHGVHTAETRPGDYEDLPGGEDQSFDTHILSWGEPYTVTFHKPGTYRYRSSYDQTWSGTVDVIERRPPSR